MTSVQTAQQPEVSVAQPTRGAAAKRHRNDIGSLVGPAVLGTLRHVPDRTVASAANSAEQQFEAFIDKIAAAVHSLRRNTNPPRARAIAEEILSEVWLAINQGWRGEQNCDLGAAVFNATRQALPRIARREGQLSKLRTNVDLGRRSAPTETPLAFLISEERCGIDQQIYKQVLAKLSMSEKNMLFGILTEASAADEVVRLGLKNTASYKNIKCRLLAKMSQLCCIEREASRPKPLSFEL